MGMKWRTMIPLLCTIALAGCGITPVGLASGKDITVADALSDVGKGFKELDDAIGDHNVLGVYPCKITVTLNVKAGSKREGELVLDVSKVSGKSGGASEAERGNSVHIEMYNSGCLPKDTLGYNSPDKVDEAMIGMGVAPEVIEATRRFNLLMLTEPSKFLEFYNEEVK